ncbi:hypothetical protein [uncultured Corynebacterium sp.]|uniref:hypothetical protein n=1 Tax=uncultured Corynebacterium sp. TaxID=159447 RepID=UPI002600A136|nr:hypothetical protein [uncultured Corynebacterium sp.]
MNVFDGRNAETVRLHSDDGEHVEFDVAEAKKLLTALVKSCDRAIGLVTLEDDAVSRDLSLWECSRPISEMHMEKNALVTDTGVYEGAPRELIDARFGKQTYEVWIEGVTESLGCSNKLPLARKIAETAGRKACRQWCARRGGGLYQRQLLCPEACSG